MPEELEPLPIEPGAQPQVIELTTYDVDTGRLFYSMRGNEGFMVLPEVEGRAWIAGEWSGATHYVSDGQPILRPVTGLPVTHTIGLNTDWVLPDVPEGTEVLIDDEEAGTVDATGLTLSFALAGVWRVDLRPPFPWVEASCEVTVT